MKCSNCQSELNDSNFSVTVIGDRIIVHLKCDTCSDSMVVYLNLSQFMP
jgi:hypothetical protein